MPALPVYLSDADLAALGIAPADIADAIEAALAEKAAGRLLAAPKSAVLPGDGRYMMSTLATGGGVTVLKAVGVYPDNSGRDLPAITGAILVLDAETGLVRALMDAEWVTAVRTAGLSAVAARRLANPDARTIAFVGCGVQARSHLDALAGAFPLTTVLAVGRGQANLDRLCDMASDIGLDARPAEADEALAQADIVVSSVTLDYSIKAFLDPHRLKPGAFAAITDLFIPWDDAGVSAFSTIVVDDLEQESTAERPMVPFQAIATDLTGLIAPRGPRFDPRGRAAFVFRGMALGDHAAAALALERAAAGGAGQPLGPHGQAGAQTP